MFAEMLGASCGLRAWKRYQEMAGKVPVDQIPEHIARAGKMSPEGVAQLRAYFRHHSPAGYYGIFPEEREGRLVNHVEIIDWAETHWCQLAAFAWERYLSEGLGWLLVIPKDAVATVEPGCLDLGNYYVRFKYSGRYEFYRPRTTVCLQVYLEDPDKSLVRDKNLLLARGQYASFEPPPPIAYEQLHDLQGGEPGNRADR